MKSRGFLASGFSTYDFSTLYTTLPHNLIKEKLTELIEQTFNREGSLYLACNDKNAFFTSEQPKRYKLWSCQKMCGHLHYLMDNIFIRFGSKLYRQIVGIPMGTNCAPLVADLFIPLQTLFVVGILFSRCPCVRPSVCACMRSSVTFCFLNNSKSHCWIFIKPCKHVHICKTNTLDEKVRARGQFY